MFILFLQCLAVSGCKMFDFFKGVFQILLNHSNGKIVNTKTDKMSSHLLNSSW